MSSAVIDAGDGLPLTVPRLLHERARERGDAILLACDDERLSYAEADRQSAAMARGLLAIGAGKGTHVGLLYPNGAAFAVGWLAAARIGSVTIPLSTFSTGAELRTLLRNADIEVLLGAPAYRNHDYVATLGAVIPELDAARNASLQSPTVPALRRVAFSTEAIVAAGSAVDDAVLSAAEDDVHSSDRMVIVHTSGSTSDPKGVIHTHGALIRHQANLTRSVVTDATTCSSPTRPSSGSAGSRTCCSARWSRVGARSARTRPRP